MKEIIEGFLRYPFFVALKNSKKISDSELSHALVLAKTINDVQKEGSRLRFVDDIISYSTDCKPSNFEDYYLSIVEVVATYLVDEEVVECLGFNDEECNKLVVICHRKQFNSKLVRLLLQRFDCFITYLGLYQYLYYQLQRDIRKAVDKVNEKIIINNYGDLKKIVDQICSGVKNDCIILFNSKVVEETLNKDLVDYIKEEYGYNYEYIHNFHTPKSDGQILSRLLYDADVWDKNIYKNLTVYTLLNCIVEKNDIAHAKKLIDYIFNKVKSNEELNYALLNGYPLSFTSITPEVLKDNCVRRLIQFFNKQQFEVSDEDKGGLVYPLYNGFDSCIKEGKKLFESFINNVYGDEADKVLSIIYDPDCIVRDKKNLGNIYHKQLTAKMILEFNYFDMYDENLIKYFYDRYNFGDNKDVLKRLFYRFYLINKIINDKNINAFYYEYLYELLDCIDNKYNTHCKFKFDLVSRKNSYKKLVKFLNSYGVNPSDEYKNMYITSMLDRKCATVDEKEMFPILEQFGDAIYQLAVDNILFFNPNTELNHENEEVYVNANFQKKIVKKFKIDGLYISALNESYNSKYESPYQNDGVLVDKNDNYLADMLEMIIGSIGFEFGVQKALDFTTQLICDYDNKLSMPLFVEYDPCNIYTSNLNKEYYEKIFPPLDPINDEYFNEYRQLLIPIKKIVLIKFFGNDTKEKRNKIKFSFGDFNYELLVIYLYQGIEKAIDYYVLKCVKENHKL